MQVTQLLNQRGNAAANQFIINSENGQTFQSYKSLIAFKPNNGDTPILSEHWDYSKTTLKHLKLFLNTSDSKKEIQQRIKEGSLILGTQEEIKKLN